ncbi:MAG: hypothetical protein AAF969_17480 [Bacteroidota bacterium]
MKKIGLVLLAISLLSCSHNPYLLSDKNSKKKFLVDYIENLKDKGFMSNKPSLVLNGELITYDSLKKCNLILYKDDIDTIYAVFKKDDLGAKHLYGDGGENGVILIQVKKHEMKCD